MSPEKQEKLKELWSQCKSVRTIAETLGVSRRTVLTQRLRLGLLGRWGKKHNLAPRSVDPDKFRELIRENWSRKKVAAYFQVSIKTLSLWKRKLGIREPFNSTRVLTINEIESIPALIKEHGSTKAVAEYLGTSQWSIQHWLRKLKQTGGKHTHSTPPEEIQPATALLRGRTIPEERRAAILAEIDAGETYKTVAARHKVAKESIRLWKKARELAKKP
jgi:transposase